MAADDFTIKPNLFTGQGTTRVDGQGDWQAAWENDFSINPSELLSGSNESRVVPAGPDAEASDDASVNESGNESSNDSAGGFQTPNFQETLTIFQDEAARRSRLAQEQARQIAGVTANVRKESQSYSRTAREVRSELTDIQAAREEAQALAESNNPLDRLNLLGAQALQPRKFTRAGRSAEADELSQLLALRGQVHNVKMKEAQARISEIEANTVARAAQGETAFERLQTRLAAMETVQRTQLATEQMRKHTLSQQTQRTLTQALNSEPDPLGFVEVGGFRYTPLELREKQKNLQERDLLSRLPTNPYNNEQLAAYQQVVLDKMDVADLETIRDSGYVHNDVTFRADMVEQRLGEAKKIEMEQVASKFNQVGNIQQHLNKEFDRAIKISEKATNDYPATSPVGNSAREYQRRIATLATFAETEEAQTPSGQVFLTQKLSEAEEAFDAAVKEEAKAQAGGDEQLTEILRQRIVGADVPAGLIYSYAEDKFIESRAFNRAMNRKDASRLMELASLEFNGIVEASVNIVGDSSMTVTERKEARAQAFGRAWDRMQNEKGVRTISDAIQVSLTPQIQAMGIAPNPLLSADIAQGEYQSIIANAESIAAKQVAANNEITQSQWKAVSEGRHAEEGISPERASEMRSQFNAQLTLATYDLIEQAGTMNGVTGLAESYTKWLEKNLIPVATRLNEVSGEEAYLFRPGVQDRARDMLGIWGMADETATRRQQQLAVESAIEFGNPEVVMPAVLDSIRDLPNEQKAQVYSRIIKPAINEARQQELGRQDTLSLIMSRLEEGRSDDPALTAASKKALRAMPSVIAIVDSTHQSVLQRVFSNQWLGAAAISEAIAPSVGPTLQNDAARALQEQNSQDTLRTWKNRPLPWMPN